jgi:hypothetical protein
MEDLRIYLINGGAISLTMFDQINPGLSFIALIGSIVYTIIGIKQRLKK